MKELNLTQGSVPKVLLQFAVPFLIANVLQALYGGADLFVVGQYDDSASVAAVAIGSQVMQTITGIILGITTGTTVLIAIATGAKDDKKVAFTIGSSVWLFSIIGVLLTLVMVFFHGRIAELMHTPIEAMADTKSYILVCSAGILFIVGYNVVCGILRGLGDSKTPLYFVALACVINIVLDFILVGYFHLGATGAAVATITAQGVSFVISLWFLYRHGFHFEFTRKDIRLNRNPGQESHDIGSAYCVAGCADQYLVSDHHRYSQSDGSDRIGFFGCRREDYSVCHAASDGNLIGSSDDDGTELRSRTYTTDEPLSGFGDRNCTCFRCIGLCVFTIPAGNAYRVLYQRCCGGINGGGVSAGI